MGFVALIIDLKRVIFGLKDSFGKKVIKWDCLIQTIGIRYDHLDLNLHADNVQKERYDLLT